jgi:hypothetical protein
MHLFFFNKFNLLADCVIYLQDSLHQQYANTDDEITMATRMLKEATPCVDKSDKNILEDIKYISSVRFSLIVVAKYFHKFYGTPQASIPDHITQRLFAAASKLCDQFKSQWPRYISYLHINISFRGRHGRDRMVVGFITTCVIMPITTKVVSLNPIHGKVYSIQHYVMKFVNDLQQSVLTGNINVLST